MPWEAERALYSFEVLLRMWSDHFKRLPGPLQIALWMVGGLLLVVLLSRNLGYFRNPVYLGGLIFLEIFLAGLWHFEVVFFPLLMVLFFWASGDPVLHSNPAMTMRWFVLALGAVAGAVLWMRGRHQVFSTLHMAALFCLLASLVSALVSNEPLTALLKVGSLFLLFLCGSTGARLALMGQETQFAYRLLFGCELFVLVSCVLGLSMGLGVLGNPNSLGAAVGVVVTPILLWGFIVAQTRSEKYLLYADGFPGISLEAKNVQCLPSCHSDCSGPVRGSCARIFRGLAAGGWLLLMRVVLDACVFAERYHA